MQTGASLFRGVVARCCSKPGIKRVWLRVCKANVRSEGTDAELPSKLGAFHGLHYRAAPKHPSVHVPRAPGGSERGCCSLWVPGSAVGWPWALFLGCFLAWEGAQQLSRCGWQRGPIPTSLPQWGLPLACPAAAMKTHPGAAL